jgi:hypothetical protein
MLIALVIILLLIWAAVVWSIYSNFTVFYSNFAESENYHRAYYNSISALERAELVIKQRSPWYIWYWSWKIDEQKWEWSMANWWSDGIISKFSYLSNNESSKNTSTIYWDINSRTTRVPSEWNWDIDAMLAANDSEDYNMMDYKDSQVFLLYYDKSEWNPYKKTKCNDTTNPCNQSKPSNIEWSIRLPWKLRESFQELDVDKALVPGWPKDDAIVDWQIRWRYYTDSNNYPFNIYSTQKYYGEDIDYEYDSAIRESDINQDLGLNFILWQDRLSPITTPNAKNHSKQIESPQDLTIISPQETTIKWSITDLGTILEEEKYKFKQLRLSLLNLLKAKDISPNNNTSVNMVYPFLEYYLDFWTNISDKYFTINAEWNYSDYQIERIVWKPTNKESILWSFTTIF